MRATQARAYAAIAATDFSGGALIRVLFLLRLLPAALLHGRRGIRALVQRRRKRSAGVRRSRAPRAACGTLACAPSMANDASCDGGARARRGRRDASPVPSLLGRNRPGTGLIRHVMLRAIRRTAEQA
ncbi:MAG: hypothetical protein ABIT20_21100 [Gemmatimonadaceae bacterium]